MHAPKASISKSAFSYLRTLTTWHCPHSPAAHAAAAAIIDRYLLPAGHTAANLQQRVCCCKPMLEQTDGRIKDSGGPKKSCIRWGLILKRHFWGILGHPQRSIYSTLFARGSSDATATTPESSIRPLT